MKRFFCLLLALCLTLCFGLALAENAAAPEASPATLTVTGEAQVIIPADYAQLVLGVSTQDESVTTASTINSTTLDAVIEALHGIGIAPEDIVTENLSVSPMYDYQYGKLGESQTVIGYQVENRLRVTVRDVNQVGAVMDAGVAAGANEAFGITLGNLVSVNENAYGGSGGVTLKYAADAAAGTTVLANDLTVSAQVTLTYQLAE